MKEILRKLYYLFSFMRFKKVGKNIILSKGGTFIRPEEIVFGNNIFISRNFHISARNLIFGNNIMIGPNLVIECDDHIYNKVGVAMFQTQKERKGSFIKLEDDIWIGAGVTILKNVIIGEGAVIGAGSIVTKDIPPYTICAGIPCKALKPRFNEQELEKHLYIVKSSKKSSEIIDLLRRSKIYV